MTEAFTCVLRRGGAVLAPFDESFIREEYVGWLNDAELMQYSEQRHRRHDRESCLSFFQGFDHTTAHFWAVCTAEGEFVGTATAYRDVPNATADMGILIGARGGTGLGTAAWLAMRDWLFSTGVRKVTAGTMSVNKPMRKLFARSAMAIEGVRRAQFLWRGQEVDLVLAAVFRNQVDLR